MEQVKVCMLGAPGVGKTSLVSRLVGREFAASYPSTAGVNITKWPLDLGERKINLILWDRSDESTVHRAKSTYLRGCSGYVLVVDQTRPDTLDRAESLQAWMRKTSGDLPFVVLINKVDLDRQQALSTLSLDNLKAQGWALFETSARSNEGIEQAFTHLGRRIAAT